MYIQVEGILSFLSKNKLAISRDLARTGAFVPRIKEDIAANESDFDDYAQREVACLVDYISLYFSEKQDDYINLYVGERLKMAYDSSSKAQEHIDKLLHFLNQDKQTFLDYLPDAEAAFREQILNFFDPIINQFQKPITREFKIMFIGDCLHLDILGTLCVLLMKKGYAISPHMITTKNKSQIHKEIQVQSDSQFDLIFYSPLSYEYDVEFTPLMHHRSFFKSESNLTSLISNSISHISGIVDRLIATFECPVFMHNTACILRDTNSLKLTAKLFLASRVRKIAKQYVDEKLRSYIENIDVSYANRIHLIDELRLVDEYSEKQLGKLIYRSPLQHPTKFGLLLAEVYERIVVSQAVLLGKKLVVCDLDNTLWDGVIGEGDVNHYLDRQQILLDLKSRGVLLAINSKNDLKNINWQGGLLSEKDFVYQSISWAPKVSAFSEMQNDLNLKTKDFIFLDDRKDELEMVASTFPEICCLDATEAGTWMYLKQWLENLDADVAMDRTQMYKDREKRAKFLKVIDEREFDEAEAFQKLELELTIREAAKEDLKRVAELINRTNQFNMCASRTTISEIESWSSDPDHKILASSMADKFGDMGVISILVYKNSGAELDIKVFVLSCRVFGYKVETAILNLVKKQATEMEIRKINGRYVPTEVNSPCQNVYPENAFQKFEELWQYSVSDDHQLEDPHWLNVKLL